MAISLLTCNRRGLALIYIVFIFIFVATLATAGLKMYSSIVTRGNINDTKSGLESQVQMITAWAVKNGRLPANADLITIFGSLPLDAWGNSVVYKYTDSGMIAADPTTGNSICGRTSTPIYYSSNTNYVAFALLSAGGTPNPLTQWPTLPAAANTPLVITQGDITRIVTLNELQARAGCSGANLGYLRIVNNELPSVCAGSSTYPGVVYGNGGVPPYTWSLVSPPSWLSINSSTGVLSPNPTITSTANNNPGYPVTIQLVDSQSTTVQRTYNLVVSNTGTCGSGNSSGGDLGNLASPPINTAATGTPDANGNSTTSALFAQSIVTPNNSIQVTNNQINFGYNAGNGSACV